MVFNLKFAHYFYRANIINFCTPTQKLYKSCLFGNEIFIGYQNCGVDYKKRLYCNNVTGSDQNSKLPKIIYFGTDAFSLSSLRLLYEDTKCSYQEINVVTVPSKGKLHKVYKYCLEKNITVIPWPLSEPLLGYDLGIVVSFGYLIPNNIIKSFPLGIINVHGSLLPRWRGAAPVIHAVLNGDHNTGITIMKIHPFRFDVGEILYSESIAIAPREETKLLTQRMATLGAKSLKYCISNLYNVISKARSQPTTGITKAPKVGHQYCQILWNKTPSLIIKRMFYAFGDHQLWTIWRGNVVKLSKMVTNDVDDRNIIRDILKERNVSDVYQFIEQIHRENFQTGKEKKIDSKFTPGKVKYSWDLNTLTIECVDGFVNFKVVTIKGKVMFAKDFYNGYLSKVQQDERIFILN